MYVHYPNSYRTFHSLEENKNKQKKHPLFETLTLKFCLFAFYLLSPFLVTSAGVRKNS